MMRISIRRMEELDRMQHDLDCERGRLLWDLLNEAAGGQIDSIGEIGREIGETFGRAHADDVRRIPPTQHDV